MELMLRKFRLRQVRFGVSFPAYIYYVQFRSNLHYKIILMCHPINTLHVRSMIQENLLSCSKKNTCIMSFKTNQLRACQLEICQFTHVINKVCMITSIRFVTSNPSINLLMNTKIELWVHLDGSHKCAMTINLIDYQCVSSKLHHKR